jgi:amino acid transporter
LQQPKAGIELTLTLGFIVCIFNGLLYAEIAGIMPRSGGDYVFLSRVLTPSIGFAGNWGLTWSQLFGVGAYSSWTISTALAPALKLVGRLNHLPYCETLANLLTVSPVQVTIATFALLALALFVSVQRIEVIRLFLSIGFFVALIGTAIVCAYLYSASYDSVASGLGRVIDPGTSGYQYLAGALARYRALSPPATEPTSVFAAIRSIPIGYWAFLGFTYSVYLGSEVSKPKRTQMIGILTALLFGYLSYMILLGRYYHLFGRHLIAALAYNERFYPGTMPVNSGFMLMIGAIVPSGLIGGLAIFSFFLWYFLLVIVMVQVCTRNVFAWSLDAVLPSWFTAVSSRNAIPRNSLIAVILIGAGFGALVSFGKINFINYVALFVACYCLTGVGAMLLPWRRPDILGHRDTGNLPQKFRTIVIVSLGAANAILFGSVLFVSLTSSDFSGVPATRWPLIFLIGVYVTGACVYWISRRTGDPLDRELLVRLPPE